MDNSKNRHNNDHLGVNKLGKNIRKSPLHQPNFTNNTNTNTNTNTNNNNNNNNNNPTRQQPQPQVYNISKNDFRNIVQQLTGSPSPADPPIPQNNNNNSPKPQSIRLQKIRPPPLNPIPNPAHFGNPFPRPGRPGPMPTMPPPQHLQHPEQAWPTNSTASVDTPITAYMKYLQNSILDPSPRGPGFPNGQPPHQQPSQGQQSFQPPLLPSPTSQFLLPSPTGYFGLLSPRSPYPLLSPGMMMQFPPLTPNFGFGQMGGQQQQQPGLLGPGPQHPPPPLSPGLVFPLSPSGFFPISSPRWRDHQ